MVEKTKVNMAARRMESANRRYYARRRPSFWRRVWNIICWPFRQIARFIRWIWRKICQFARWIWKKICEINLVGLLNLVLLIAIVVLCAMLIIDILHYRKKSVVIVADPVSTTSINTSKQNSYIVAEPTTKPVRASAGYIRPDEDNVTVTSEASKPIAAEPIHTRKPHHEQNRPTIVKECVTKMYGDVIVDSRDNAKMLEKNTQINGNLYLQNMRKYVLPCDIKINGNMFIRDVSMLQFCGDFEITGNIYVSPRSSFGPIPSTARLGGQVIL